MAESSGARVLHGDKTGLIGSDYQVFLSFRGPDTRVGITDVLFQFMTDKGICVFRDDEKIRDELHRAIQGSRVYMVVFSRGYASSAWCLRELAMMVDCCRDSVSGKVFLPIFYDVDPQDVKLQTHLYRGDLDKHIERYGEEGVKRWKDALVIAGGICGWDYKSHMGEGEFSKLIVQAQKKLNTRDRRLLNHLIGIEDHVKSVMNLLKFESPDVRVVMLHGMGGIGKTTLANTIFNKISSQFSQFDGCSFLANVRESMSTCTRGVTELQKKLLGDVLGRSSAEIGDSCDGWNNIKTRLKEKRVLIIFDDVSERSQLKELVGTCDFFGPGTRIIVTTRDKSVSKGLLRNGGVYTYEMEGMRDDHAHQLFNWHAFGCEGPRDGFVDLSMQVIHTTGNLPLALEVIGGHLFNESKDVWEDILKELKKVPDEGVMKILRISYDSLKKREKRIFLDIACFTGDVMPRKYASYMWEACGC